MDAPDFGFGRWFDDVWTGMEPLLRETDVTTTWRPAVDIAQEPGRYVVFADIPGVRNDDLEITLEDNELIVRGERLAGDGELRFAHRERVFGPFSFRVSLPEGADPEGIEARVDYGVLTVYINKRKELQPKRIQVLH